MTKDTGTIQYWIDNAVNSLNKAVDIAEATGQGFEFSYKNWRDMEYIPESQGAMSKDRALALLAEGRDLTEGEKTAIRNAIENDRIRDENDDWYSSDKTGWVSSSDKC